LKDEATGRAVQEATFMELAKEVGAAAAGTPDSTCWNAVVEAHNLLEKEVRAVDVAAGSPDPAYWTAVVEVRSLLEREVGAAVVEHHNLLERVVGADDAADAAAGTIISAPLSSTPHDKLPWIVGFVQEMLTFVSVEHSQQLGLLSDDHTNPPAAREW
jgi:hypothetical protein